MWWPQAVPSVPAASAAALCVGGAGFARVAGFANRSGKPLPFPGIVGDPVAVTISPIA
jgi:hypothetical protein